MKIITKNYSLENGNRSYLIYLTDENNNSIECFDIKGDKLRLEKEEELSKKYNVSTNEIEYVSLEQFKLKESNNDKPLILVFYLDRELFQQRDGVALYGERVKNYFDEVGDNVRLFFMPTDTEERIECINPIYIDDENEFNKLNDLIQKVSEVFQMGGKLEQE
jgi:hypothetical protein